MSRRVYRVLLGTLVLFLIACYIYVGEGIDAFYQSRLADMVHGTAYRPFVGRMLVPAIARLATAATPSAVSNQLIAVFQAWTWRPAGWNPDHATEYVFVLLLLAVSLLGFAAALERLFHTMFHASDSIGFWVVLITLACLPAFYGPFSRQIYDFTTLWFFTLGLTFIARSQWTAFAILFPIACVNKETTILLTLVYVFHARRDPSLQRGAFVRLLLYQAIVFVAVRGLVGLAFRENQGQTVLFHLFLHNQYVLTHPSQMSRRVILAAAAIVLALWRWREKPMFLRNSFVVLAPTLLVMGLTVGWIDEIRAYYEIYPVVALLIASGVRYNGTEGTA